VTRYSLLEGQARKSYCSKSVLYSVVSPTSTQFFVLPPNCVMRVVPSPSRMCSHGFLASLLTLLVGCRCEQSMRR